MYTRKRNDLVQRQKQGDILTQSLRYTMGTPGIKDPGYIPNVHIRPQYWSGNIRQGSLQINTGLMGLGAERTAVWGGTEMDARLTDPSQHPLRSEKVVAMNIQDSRIVSPAWKVREKGGVERSQEMRHVFRPYVVRPAVPTPIQTRSAYFENLPK